MSGNVIQFPKKPKMIPGWDLLCVVFRQSDERSANELQDALDQGYEPFTVTVSNEIVVDPISRQPSGMVSLEKIWFKRPAAPVPEELDPQLA